MTNTQVKWHVNFLADILALYDQTKVFRRVGLTGTWIEITAESTRVPLVEGQSNYEYIDPDGDSNFWYRTAYFSSTTLDEASPSTAFMGDIEGQYCSLQDIRDEGYSDTDYSDDRLALAIKLASQVIERATGRWFGPRDRTYPLNGSGVATLFIGVPIIDITEVKIDDTVVDLADLVIYNRHVTEGLREPDDRANPRIKFDDAYYETAALYGAAGVWPKGKQNIEVTGTFGYTDYDETVSGKVPGLIKHLCKLLTIRNLPTLSDTDAREDATARHRVRQYKTRDQSITFDVPKLSPSASLMRGMLTGDPEIDSIIMSYRRPRRMAVV